MDRILESIAGVAYGTPPHRPLSAKERQQEGIRVLEIDRKTGKSKRSTPKEGVEAPA